LGLLCFDACQNVDRIEGENKKKSMKCRRTFCSLVENCWKNECNSVKPDAFCGAPGKL
jgi:hypothetical protein